MTKPKVTLKPPKVGRSKASKDLAEQPSPKEPPPSKPEEEDGLTTAQRVMGKWPPNNF